MQTTRPTIYATSPALDGRGSCRIRGEVEGQKEATQGDPCSEKRDPQTSAEPLLGEFRVHTARLREGIDVSPATCGRIMAANRQLYGLEQHKREGRAKLEILFVATARQKRS